jgi:nitrite reductase/ring-hydroxylating ferredoxin subunit
VVEAACIEPEGEEGAEMDKLIFPGDAPTQPEGGVFLCPSGELENGGQARGFDVVYAGQTCRAFVIRFEGEVHAYLNRCTHIAMEMDYRENHFFDAQGQWLMCATHGATYSPQSGDCVGGPCRGGLIKIEVIEKDEAVYWLTQYNLKKPDELD